MLKLFALEAFKWPLTQRVGGQGARHLAFVLTAVLAVSLLAACSPIRTVGPTYQRPELRTAPAWVAPLPHNASTGDLTRWWQQFDDPLLVSLIERSQVQAPTLSQALFRITQARGVLTNAGASAQPSLDIGGSFNRAAVSFGGPLFIRSLAQVQAQSAWEIDLFGANQRQREAAAARLEARSADWHDARVAVAVEVASLYVQLRYCELQVALFDEDLKSRRETVRLTELTTKAGFQAPANAALIQASASDAAARLTAQVADCDVLVKSLVALTSSEEVALRTELAAARAKPPKPAEFDVASVPANLLTQRPDLASAERELAAASADIGAAEAARYPSLSLSGSIAPILLAASGQTLRATTWSIGPALNLPVFDGGRRAANLDTAKANYELAQANYRQKALQAVREVEEALIRLASAKARESDMNAASQGYRTNLGASQARFSAGLGSALELEESRRLALVAQANVIGILRDRTNAWISLYRALGGGWSGDVHAPESGKRPKNLLE